MSDKIYVPGSAKEHVFKDGGTQIKLGFKAEALVAFVKEHTNEKGYINLLVTRRKEVGKYGETHSISLDTWTPGQGKGATASAPAGQQTEAQKLLASRKGSEPPAQPERLGSDDGETVPF